MNCKGDIPSLLSIFMSYISLPWWQSIIRPGGEWISSQNLSWRFREMGSSLSSHDIIVCAWCHSTLHSTTSQRVSGLTHHSGLGVALSAIAEGGGQGGGATLVIQGRPTVVDGWVDGDGPHAGGIAIAVAVIVAAAVPGGPYVDAAFAASALGEDKRDAANTPGNQGLKGVLPGVGDSPSGELDLNFLSSSTKWLDSVLSAHKNHCLLVSHQEYFFPSKDSWYKVIWTYKLSWEQGDEKKLGESWYHL